MTPDRLADATYLIEVRKRRLLGFLAIALMLGLDTVATGVVGGGERTLAIVRSIILPGLPFLEWQPFLGVAAIAAALAAVGAWLRWGMDWAVMIVILVCVSITVFVMPLHHANASQHHDFVGASHEFTVVLVVFAMLARVRLLVARLPGGVWLKAHLPQGVRFPAVDTARAAAILLLADPNCGKSREFLGDSRLTRRAARVNAWARFRFGDGVLRGAHAPLRAALSLADQLDTTEMLDWRMEARRCLAGVPDSEPTWTRLLDGVLAARSLQHLGEEECTARWCWVLKNRFALRHGRRPSALHTPSMLSLGTATAWEHAAATALACEAGWIDVADWQFLRPRCLGAAASADTDPATLRLVAAGRIWAMLTRDLEARAVLDRRTITDDPLACALDRFAQQKIGHNP